MKKYDIVAVLWNDHIAYRSSPLPETNNLEDAPLSLTLGILYSETDSTIIIVSHVEPYPDFPSCDYTLILKAAVVSMKRYGKIKVNLKPHSDKGVE